MKIKANNHAYSVHYKLYDAGEIKSISFLAKSKMDAYEKAVFTLIPEKEHEMPYSAWVYEVTYNNGNSRHFNTHEGMPY